ncbi:hypothetical protein SESBI_21199 [Sesbania bispinosa]|nr:hypothetical protein SESBI_21199 [Sesbania bispinosa]
MSDELGKLKHDVKVLLQHGHFGVDLESLQGLLASSPGDAGSAQRVVGQPHAPSSTSTHAPNIGKVIYAKVIQMKTWNMPMKTWKKMGFDHAKQCPNSL